MKKMTAFASAVLLLWTLHTAVPAAREDARTDSADSAAFELAIDPTVREVAYSLGTPVLYAYGPDQAGGTLETGGREARIALSPRRYAGDGRPVSDAYKITQITARAITPNVIAEVDRRDGTVYDGKNGPLLTLTAAVGPEAVEMQDYEVVLEMTVGDWNGLNLTNKREVTVTVKGKESVGYSRARAVTGGETFRVNEQEGCVFSTQAPVSPPALVDCGGGVSVTLEGDYGEGSFNLLRADAPISRSLERRLPSDARYFAFIASPQLAAPARVSVSAPEDSGIYEITDGGFTKVETAYENGVHCFDAARLSRYIVTSKRL